MMVFRNGGYLKQTEKWFFNNECVETVTYYNYLGLQFSSRLNWSKNVENNVMKALRIIQNIRRMFQRLDILPLSLASKIFDVKIKPILLYGSEVWGVKKYECLENLQIRYFKMFLGVGKTTENCFILREVGRYPLWVVTKCNALKYWCKLLTLSNERYPKHCYLQQYSHAQLGRDNWAAAIRDILSNSGFAHIWHEQNGTNRPCIIQEIKQRLIAISNQNMEADIRNTHSVYLDYHPIMKPAEYIDVLVSRRKRRLITLLRTRSLPIKNNLFRIKICDSNVCIKCCSNSIDDETHFLFKCQALNNSRFTHLPATFLNNPSAYKLISLFKSNDPKVLNNVCLFIQEVLYSNDIHDLDYTL